MRSPSTIRPVIARRIRQVRVLRGWTQVELARRCGFKNQQQINHFESGRREPSLSTLVRLADALDVTADALLGRGDLLESPL